MNKYFKKIADSLLKGEFPQEYSRPSTIDKQNLPVIWLLGKTGAGKTSLVRCLTGLSTAEIGNGYAPCTRASQEFGFPSDDPVVRFLDTRGLDENAYDPAEDLKLCADKSHVVVVVARLDDPVQQNVADVLNGISKRASETPIIIVHSGADRLDNDQQRKRARNANQQLFDKAAGRQLSSVETALPPHAIGPTAQGIDALLDALIEAVPGAVTLMMQQSLRNDEEIAYKSVSTEVIRYACAAGSADLAPVVGAVAGPVIQAALLASLAKHYQISWTRSRLTQYSLALGAGVLFRFGGSYLSRQAAKLIPVYGQSLGAIASGTISFATTFALGRSAAYYLYKTQRGKPIDHNAIRRIYKEALQHAVKTKYFERKDA